MAVKNLFRCLFGLLIFLTAGLAQASLLIPIYLEGTNGGQGDKIGTVKAEDTSYGLLLTPALEKLPPGIHGFHIHSNPSCANHGMAAGGHLDPQKTNQHKGPYDKTGHLGDLPALTVDSKGNANLPVLAPRLKVSQIEGHSLMIHAGGDNYSDKPEPNGGGGARIACGTIGMHVTQ